jgi:serine/alanine racemase
LPGGSSILVIVDVTSIPDIKRGDIVTLIGKDSSEEIDVEQLAFSAGTTTNELLSRLSDSLLKRIWLKSRTSEIEL